MSLATNQRMTIEEYLTYDDGTNTRHELVDGVLSEYLAWGIPEYWIIDPTQLRITVCVVVERQYQQAVFQGDEMIQSVIFPTLTLTADQILNAGR